MQKENLTARVALVGFGKLVAALVLLAVDIFLARVISRSNFGDYRQTWLIFNVCYPIFVFGIPASLFYLYPRIQKDQQRKTLILQTILLSSGLGLIFATFLRFSSKLWIEGFHNLALFSYISPLSIYALTAVGTCFADALLLSADRPFTQLFFSLSQAIILGVSFYLPILAGGNLTSCFWWLAILAVLRLCALFIYTYAIFKFLRFRLPFLEIRLLWSQVKYALPIGLSAAVGVLSEWADKAVVSAFFPPSIFAAYSIGATEIPFIGILTASVNTVLQPALNRLASEDNKTEMLKLWHEAAVKLSLVLLPLFVYLFTFANYIVPLLYSDRYHDATLPFRIYLFLLPLRIASYGAFIIAIGRPGVVFWASSGELIANIVLSIGLIKVFGYWGPALSGVLVTYMQVICLLWVITRSVGTRFKSILPWKDLAFILGVSLISLSLCIPVLFWNPSRPITVSLSVLLFMSTFLGITVRWRTKRFREPLFRYSLFDRQTDLPKADREME